MPANGQEIGDDSDRREMTDPTLNEVRALLLEIRDLLLPVSDAYREQYEERVAAREAARRKAIKAMLYNPKRARAWGLADGTRTRSEIAKQVPMDAGDTSRFFRSLAELKAVSDGPKPKRLVDV